MHGVEIETGKDGRCPMPEYDEILYCVGCGAEVALSPFMKDDQSYCCSDCANGLECDCGVTFDEEEAHQKGE
jgi:hypothetical protein